MDRSKIPFYASQKAQSFINFELSTYEKENITTDPGMVEHLMKSGYTVDDIGLLDAVNILCAHNVGKARQAARSIQHQSARQSATRSILCFEDRCIR
ncbi:MAG: hypothetical protein AB1847_16690 [bacterium]